MIFYDFTAFDLLAVIYQWLGMILQQCRRYKLVTIYLCSYILKHISV